MIRALLALIWLSHCLPELASGQEPRLAAINRYILEEMARQRIPGMSVAVLRGDRILLARGYGFANLELHVPASDTTLYQSGSVGKQFTSALVVTLARQGRFQLDDRIVNWLPEGAGVWDSVTVRHLLTHTSGIREYTDSTFNYRKDYTEDQLVRFAASRPLEFVPGRRWAYSNTGYVLLGALVHRVTGRFYGDLLRDLVFLPSGMRTARIISEADIVPNRAAGYQLSSGRVSNQDWVAPSLNTTADGSLYFSVRDLAKWAEALNHRRIPDSAALRASWTPVRLNDGGLYPYGLGWDLTPQRGHPRVGHTGSWQGFKTAIYRYPEFNLTVAALANLAQAEPGAIAEGIAGILEPTLQPPQRLVKALPGPRSPAPITSLLRQISRGDDTTAVTPGLRHFLSSGARTELEQTTDSVRNWKELGCDDVSGRRMVWLSSRIERVCYHQGSDRDGAIIVSVFHTADWRAVHFEVVRY